MLLTFTPTHTPTYMGLCNWVSKEHTLLAVRSSLDIEHELSYRRASDNLSEQSCPKFQNPFKEIINSNEELA